MESEKLSRYLHSQEVWQHSGKKYGILLKTIFLFVFENGGCVSLLIDRKELLNVTIRQKISECWRIILENIDSKLRVMKIIFEKIVVSFTSERRDIKYE